MKERSDGEWGAPTRSSATSPFSTPFAVGGTARDWRILTSCKRVRCHVSYGTAVAGLAICSGAALLPGSRRTSSGYPFFKSRARSHVDGPIRHARCAPGVYERSTSSPLWVFGRHRGGAHFSELCGLA